MRVFDFCCKVSQFVRAAYAQTLILMTSQGGVCVKSSFLSWEDAYGIASSQGYVSWTWRRTLQCLGQIQCKKANCKPKRYFWIICSFTTKVAELFGWRAKILNMNLKGPNGMLRHSNIRLRENFILQSFFTAFAVGCLSPAMKILPRDSKRARFFGQVYFVA